MLCFPEHAGEVGGAHGKSGCDVLHSNALMKMLEDIFLGAADEIMVVGLANLLQNISQLNQAGIGTAQYLLTACGLLNQLNAGVRYIIEGFIICQTFVDSILHNVGDETQAGIFAGA